MPYVAGRAKLVRVQGDVPSASGMDAGAKSALVQGIAMLPPLQADIIVLHYLRNVPLAEVAKVLRVSPEEVAEAHHAALMELRRLTGASLE